MEQGCPHVVDGCFHARDEAGGASAGDGADGGEVSVVDDGEGLVCGVGFGWAAWEDSIQGVFGLPGEDGVALAARGGGVEVGGHGCMVGGFGEASKGFRGKGCVE